MPVASVVPPGNTPARRATGAAPHTTASRPAPTMAQSEKTVAITPTMASGSDPARAARAFGPSIAGAAGERAQQVQHQARGGRQQNHESENAHHGFLIVHQDQDAHQAAREHSEKVGVKRAESRAKITREHAVFGHYVGQLALQQDPAVERAEAADGGEHGHDLAGRGAPEMRRQIDERRVRGGESVAGGTSNSTVVQAMMQMSAVMTVPSKVARGMVRPGSRTLLAGMVADSRPRSAQSVSVAAAVVLTDSGMPAAAAVTVVRAPRIQPQGGDREQRQ
jgi:hypothetical protein